MVFQEIVEFDLAAPQDGALARALGALASPPRLALLRQLRTPKTLREIAVKTAPGGNDDGSGARVMSRQAVREHLDRLLEIGVVVPREVERDYGQTVEYLLNHQVLFALAEEFRGLARLRPSTEPSLETVKVSATQPGALTRGPCLILVKGLDEGRTFDLRPPADGSREWVIGRRRGADVALDFDPFVSMENAAVVWDDSAHHLVDLPDSRNGTLLNFERVAQGRRHVLRTGDLIGVGRCILMYRG